MNEDVRNHLLAQQALTRICNNVSENPNLDSEIIHNNYDKNLYLNVEGFLAAEGFNIDSDTHTKDEKIYATRETFSGYHAKNNVNVQNQFKILIKQNQIRLARETLDFLKIMVEGNPQEIAQKLIKHWNEGSLTPQDLQLDPFDFQRPKKRWTSIFERPPVKSISDYINDNDLVSAALRRVRENEASKAVHQREMKEIRQPSA